MNSTAMGLQGHSVQQTALQAGCAVEGEEPAVKKKVVYGKKKPQAKAKPADGDAQLASASSDATAAAEAQAAAEASTAAAQAQAELAKELAQQAEEERRQQEAQVCSANGLQWQRRAGSIEYRHLH